jgi:hypothetical protein
VSSSDDATVRALLRQVRRRANLLRDAAIALTTETARAGEIDGLIAALQEAHTNLLLAIAEQAVRGGTSTAGEIAATRTEWPADSTPDFPHSMQPRPWKPGGKGGRSGPRK